MDLYLLVPTKARCVSITGWSDLLPLPYLSSDIQPHWTPENTLTLTLLCFAQAVLVPSLLFMAKSYPSFNVRFNVMCDVKLFSMVISLLTP